MELSELLRVLESKPVNHGVVVLSFPEYQAILQALKPKRRGRPPKKVTEVPREAIRN